MKKIFLAATVLLSVNCFAQSYTPSVKLTAGKKYAVNSSSKGSMAQEAMGQSMEIPMDISSSSTLEVKEASAAGCKMASTTSHIVLSISMMGQDMSYDSDKKEDRDGQLGAALNDQLNQTITFSIDNSGKIIEGSVVKPEVKKNENTEAANPLLAMMGLGDNTLATSPAINLFSSSAAIKPGDSFTDNTVSDSSGKSKSSMTYTLAEVKDGVARFAITGTSNISKEMEMQGMQATTNTSSKITGEMLVDVTTGLLIKKTLNTAITGTTDIAGMSIPQSGNMVVMVTVTEIK